MKRLFDLTFTLAVLICGAPIFLIIALLIKLTSPGPVLYKQQRIGQYGAPIFCYKFRSMYKNADKKLKELLASNPKLQEEWNTYYKLKTDPRITPLGNFLRKTSLDELPQFFNVLLGDLSIVGPRPVTEHEIKTYYKDRASLILSVRPGITGLWQTSGRSHLSFDERLILEERYVKERSFILDLKLIAKTIPAMLHSKGAY
jgi:exopolysaccharide production protein ExoY